MTSIEKKIDADIDRAWGILAHGVQVNVFDIPKIFAEIRAAIAVGISLQMATLAAIAKYRKN